VEFKGERLPCLHPFPLESQPKCLPENGVGKAKLLLEGVLLRHDDTDLDIKELRHHLIMLLEHRDKLVQAGLKLSQYKE